MHLTEWANNRLESKHEKFGNKRLAEAYLKAIETLKIYASGEADGHFYAENLLVSQGFIYNSFSKQWELRNK